MNTLLIAWSITTAQILLGCAMACAVLRMMWGPRAPDRVLGLDTLYVNVMLLPITLGIQTGRAFYYEAPRAEARRGGEEGVSTFNTRESPTREKKKNKKK